MPGLYFHIPFCKKACHYCNFHFSTSLALKEEMIKSLMQELSLRADYLQDKNVDSVYFGGGTPSLLDVVDLERIFTHIDGLFKLLPQAEITLEANPDDLSRQKLEELRAYSPVNRLSIGIQSFSDEDLIWMNRAHQAAEARQSLENALSLGFEDLSIDLIYGSPTTTDAQWAENLRIAFEYGIPHLSSYCLTVEEGTALGHFVKKGKQAPMDDLKAERQFQYLVDACEKQGMEQYEISNFAFPGRHARHNSSYWSGAHYLGLGPSAHSYDGVSRQWNIANNALYIKAIMNQDSPFEREVLSPTQRYNEYVMTGLRTIWGVDLAKIRELGPPYAAYFEAEMAEKIMLGQLERVGDSIRIAKAAKFLADGIASDLFFVE